jgi:hypothetical protein
MINIKNLKKYIKLYWFEITITLIVVLAIILRFSNYDNRWILGGDQSSFALNARYMISSHSLPFLGPFSSAGPFQTSGIWYWIIALGTLLNPHLIYSPWIFLTCIYVLFVILTTYIGYKLEGKSFAIIVCILSTLSTAEIAHGVNLSNQTPVPFFALLAIFASVMYLQKRQQRYIFLLGFSVGIASAIHLQGIALMSLILFTLLIGKVKSPTSYLLLLIGLFLPWAPVFYIDYSRHFRNTNNMIYYFLFEKNKPEFAVLGRRWLTFVTKFIPQSWGIIVAGIDYIGYLFAVLFPIFFIFKFYKKTLKKEWIVIGLSLVLMEIILRYTRTPLFDTFYAFLHPFIILISGYLIYIVFRRQKYIGLLFLIVVSISALQSDINQIKTGFTNNLLNDANISSQKINAMYPNKNFAIYDYLFQTSAESQTLSLIYSTKNRIDDHGTRVGVSNRDLDSTSKAKFLFTNGAYRLYDLSGLSSAEVISEGWVLVNPSAVYASTQSWYKNAKNK